MSTSTPSKPKKQSSILTILGKTGAMVVLLAGLVVTLLPFTYVFVSSFKSNAELRINPPKSFFPIAPTIENYVQVLTNPKIPIVNNVANSFIVAIARVCITLFTSSFAGYIFAKYKFRGQHVAFGLILIQIMVPFQVILIPQYLIAVKLGIIDSLWALIIPFMLDAFGIFMMKQFIESLPSELMEAARIDGASDLVIYFRIVLPQMGPPRASLGIFTFMSTWNDYLWPLIIITTPANRTVQLLLVFFQDQNTANQALVLAASMLVLLPIFIVYFFAQRWIVDQATSSAFK